MRALIVSVCVWSLCVLFAASATRAEAQPEPTIELLTMEPGASMWERFGHTALRVREANRDLVFSFGAAPFMKPSFMWAFARGEGDFFVVAEPFARSLARYQRTDRTVQSQLLELPSSRNRWLVEKLRAHIRPPHNRYRYDQLYDNCATRLRDLIDTASEGALTRAAELRSPDRRFRDYTLEAMAGHPVGHWALDLLGGSHQDLPVDGFKEMYLPVHLRDRVAEARIDVAGTSVPLAGELVVLHERRAAPALSGNWYAARYVMLTLALLLLGCVLYGGVSASLPMRRLSGYAVATLSVWSGLFGLLVVPMTLLSRVQNFSPNENALLFIPFDVLCARPLYRLAMRAAPSTYSMRVYVGLRLAMFAYLIVFKLIGVFTQHNATFIAIAGAFLLSAVFVTVRAGKAPTTP